MRERIAEMVARDIEDRLHGQVAKRARRLLRREAVLAALEELGLVKRTPGGGPLRVVEEDIFS